MPVTPRVRMSPARRREQLLDLGVTLLATRSLDELSIEILAEVEQLLATPGRTHPDAGGGGHVPHLTESRSASLLTHFQYAA